MNNISVSKNLEELSEKAARLILERLKNSLNNKSKASVILAGGNSPRKCYEILSGLIMQLGDKEKTSFIKKIDWFFGDERWVRVTHQDSNERMARESLLSPIGVSEHLIHSWHAGENSPVKKAEQYEKMLANYYGINTEAPDLVLLGMGPDGHTASLFPNSELVFRSQRIPISKNIISLIRYAAAVHKKDEDVWRLSMLPFILNRAKTMIFLIAGSDKKTAFNRLVVGDEKLPISWLRGRETLYFITDSIKPPPSTTSSL